MEDKGVFQALYENSPASDLNDPNYEAYNLTFGAPLLKLDEAAKAGDSQALKKAGKVQTILNDAMRNPTNANLEWAQVEAMREIVPNSGIEKELYANFARNHPREHSQKVYDRGRERYKGQGMSDRDLTLHFMDLSINDIFVPKENTQAELSGTTGRGVDYDKASQEAASRYVRKRQLIDRMKTERAKILEAGGNPMEDDGFKQLVSDYTTTEQQYKQANRQRKAEIQKEKQGLQSELISADDEQRGEIQARLKEIDEIERGFYDPTRQVRKARMEMGDELSRVATDEEIETNPVLALQKYYSSLEMEKREILRESDIGDQGVLDNMARMTVAGEDPMMARYADIVNRQETLAPIIFFNDSPLEIEEDTFGDRFKESFGESLFGEAASRVVLGTKSDVEQAQYIYEAMQIAGIDEEEVLGEAARERLKEIQDEGLWDPRFWGTTTGATTALMLQVATGSGVARAGKLTKPIEALKRLKIAKPTTRGQKAYNAMVSTVQEGLGAGVSYETAGEIFKNNEDELTFAGGFFGGAASQMVRGGVQKAAKHVGALFGNKAPQAMRLIEKYGSRIAGGALGESAEETAQELTRMYNESNTNQEFWGKVSEFYGDIDQLTKFYVSTMIMGAGMGAGNSGGIGQSVLDYGNELRQQLTPEQQEQADELLNEYAEASAEAMAQMERDRDEEAKQIAEDASVEAPTETTEARVTREIEELQQVVDSEEATEEDKESARKEISNKQKALEGLQQEVAEEEITELTPEEVEVNEEIEAGQQEVRDTLQAEQFAQEQGLADRGPVQAAEAAGQTIEEYTRTRVEDDITNLERDLENPDFSEEEKSAKREELEQKKKALRGIERVIAGEQVREGQAVVPEVEAATDEVVEGVPEGTEFPFEGETPSGKLKADYVYSEGEWKYRKRRGKNKGELGDLSVEEQQMVQEQWEATQRREKMTPTQRQEEMISRTRLMAPEEVQSRISELEAKLGGGSIELDENIELEQLKELQKYRGLTDEELIARQEQFQGDEARKRKLDNVELVMEERGILGEEAFKSPERTSDGSSQSDKPKGKTSKRRRIANLLADPNFDPELKKAIRGIGIKGLRIREEITIKEGKAIYDYFGHEDMIVEINRQLDRTKDVDFRMAPRHVSVIYHHIVAEQNRRIKEEKDSEKRTKLIQETTNLAFAFDEYVRENGRGNQILSAFSRLNEDGKYEYIRRLNNTRIDSHLQGKEPDIAAARAELEELIKSGFAEEVETVLDAFLEEQIETAVADAPTTEESRKKRIILKIEALQKRLRGDGKVNFDPLFGFGAIARNLLAEALGLAKAAIIAGDSIKTAVNFAVRHLNIREEWNTGRQGFDWEPGERLVESKERMVRERLEAEIDPEGYARRKTKSHIPGMLDPDIGKLENQIREYKKKIRDQISSLKKKKKSEESNAKKRELQKKIEELESQLTSDGQPDQIKKVRDRLARKKKAIRDKIKDLVIQNRIYQDSFREDLTEQLMENFPQMDPVVAMELHIEIDKAINEHLKKNRDAYLNRYKPKALRPAQRKELVQKAIEAVNAGILDDRKWRNIYASVLGVPVLTDAQMDEIRVMTARIQDQVVLRDAFLNELNKGVVLERDIKEAEESVASKKQEIVELEQRLEVEVNPKRIDSLKVALSISRDQLKELVEQLGKKKDDLKGQLKTIKSAKKMHDRGLWLSEPALRRVSEYVKGPKGAGNIMMTIAQGNLLMPKSHMANILGNLVFMPIRFATSVMADLTLRLTQGVAYAGTELADTKVGNALRLQKGTEFFRLEQIAEFAKNYRAEWMFQKTYGSWSLGGLKKGTRQAFTGVGDADLYKGEASVGLQPGWVDMATVARRLNQEYKKRIKGKTVDEMAKIEGGVMVERIKRAWAKIQKKNPDEYGKKSLNSFFVDLVQSTLGIQAEFNFRILNMFDQPHRMGAYAVKGMQLANQKGLSGLAAQEFLYNPDPESKQLMEDAGKEATFQGRTTSTEIVMAIGNAIPKQLDKLEKKAQLGIIPIALKYLYTSRIPFKATPWNIARETIHYAFPPISLARGFAYMSEFLKDGNTETFLKAQNMFGRAIVGAGMMVGTYFIVQAMLALGSGEEEEKDKGLKKAANLYRRLGLRPHTLNASGLARFFTLQDPSMQKNDVWVEYEKLGVFGGMLAIASDMSEKDRKLMAMTGEGLGMLSMMEEAGLSMVRSTYENSMMSGFAKILDKIKQPDWHGLFVLDTEASALAGITGNLFATIRRNLSRDYKIDRRSDEYKTVYGVLKERYVSDPDLPYAINAWGEKIPATPKSPFGKWGRLLGDALNSEVVNMSDRDAELWDLYNETLDIGIYPGSIRTIQHNGKDIGWTGKQAQEFREMVGKKRASLFDLTLQSGILDDETIPNEDKVKHLKKIYRQGHKVGKAEFRAKYPELFK